MLRIYAQALDKLCVCLNMYLFNAWFPPFHCHSAVAVSPLQLRKFRKNYVSAVRITLLTWKNPLRSCRFHLPLHRKCRSVAIGSNPIFSRSYCYTVWSAIGSGLLSVRPSVRPSVYLWRCALWLSGVVYGAKSCSNVLLASMFLFVPFDTFAVGWCIV